MSMGKCGWLCMNVCGMSVKVIMCAVCDCFVSCCVIVYECVCVIGMNICVLSMFMLCASVCDICISECMW